MRYLVQYDCGFVKEVTETIYSLTQIYPYYQIVCIWKIKIK